MCNIFDFNDIISLPLARIIVGSAIILTDSNDNLTAII